MGGQGLSDARHRVSRAYDFAHLCAEPVGRWDEVRGGDDPARSDAPCPDLPWLTGLWGRLGSKGVSVLAYLVERYAGWKVRFAGVMGEEGPLTGPGAFEAMGTLVVNDQEIMGTGVRFQ